MRTAQEKAYVRKRVRRIMALCERGTSQKAIASLMHTTIGGIAGTIYREGLRLRAKTKPSKKEKPMQELEQPANTFAALVWHAKSLLDLAPGDCRFSTSTADDMDGNPIHLFCSAPSSGG